MKKGTIFTLTFRIMGIVVLILGIRLIGAGVWNYIDEYNQKDWITINAEVIDISSKYSGSTKHGRSVNYDIIYQYEVNGKEYSDKLYNRSTPMGLGDKIKIKYDPNTPKDSTDILSPSLHNLIVFLVFGILLTTVGFFFQVHGHLLVKYEEEVNRKRKKYCRQKNM